MPLSNRDGPFFLELTAYLDRLERLGVAIVLMRQAARSRLDGLHRERLRGGRANAPHRCDRGLRTRVAFGAHSRWARANRPMISSALSWRFRVPRWRRAGRHAARKTRDHAASRLC